MPWYSQDDVERQGERVVDEGVEAGVGAGGASIAGGGPKGVNRRTSYPTQT